nr:virginiamycin b lyase [Quercus suber]
MAFRSQNRGQADNTIRNLGWPNLDRLRPQKAGLGQVGNNDTRGFLAPVSTYRAEQFMSLSLMGYEDLTPPYPRDEAISILPIKVSWTWIAKPTGRYAKPFRVERCHISMRRPQTLTWRQRGWQKKDWPSSMSCGYWPIPQQICLPTMLTTVALLAAPLLAIASPMVDRAAGTFTFYDMKTPLAGPCDLAKGPDGALWGQDILVEKIFRVDPKTGNVDEYDIPFTTPFSNQTLPDMLPLVQNRTALACAIRSGADGNLYAGNGLRNQLVRINPTTKKIDIFEPPPNNPAGTLFPFNDIYTSDTGLYYTQTTGNSFNFFDYASESFTEVYNVPTPLSIPLGIFVASDKLVYICELIGNKILIFDPSTKTMNEYPLPSPLQGPAVVRAEHNGYVYFSLFTEVYNQYDWQASPVDGKVTLVFAERSYRRLLRWADDYPYLLDSTHDSQESVVLMRMLFHIVVMDLFRPFTQAGSRLSTFVAPDSSPDAVFMASFKQLQAMILVHSRRHALAGTHGNMVPFLIYTLNANLKNQHGDISAFVLRHCAAILCELSQSFPVAATVLRGIMAMALRHRLVTFGDARAVENRMQQYEQQRDMASCAARSTFVLDFDHTTPATDVNKTVDALADEFQSRLAFYQFTADGDLSGKQTSSI